MRNPVFAFFLALDRAVEKVCDLAFESAVADLRARPKPELSERQKVLVAVSGGRVDDVPAEALENAIGAFMVERNGDDFSLTSLGRYLLPAEARSGTRV
jgi:hypothetical protein